MNVFTAEVERSREQPASSAGKRAFIAAPPSTDTSVIRQVLERQGVSAFTADELDLPGVPLPEIIREAVERADIVVAVTGDKSKNNSNVFLELGFALAMKKRTFLILDADAHLPTDTAGIPYLRASPTNSDAIQYGLSQFVSATHHGARAPSKAVAETRCLGSEVDELLARLRASKATLTETELVTIISDAIRRTGVSAISEQFFEQSNDVRADLAVWSDDLEPWVPNPLLIEVKSLISSQRDAEALFGMLYRLLPAARATWALVIYLEGREEFLSTVERGPILAISAEQFLESLRTTSFGDLVRNLRNARVHGR